MLLPSADSSEAIKSAPNLRPVRGANCTTISLIRLPRSMPSSLKDPLGVLCELAPGVLLLLLPVPPMGPLPRRSYVPWLLWGRRGRRMRTCKWADVCRKLIIREGSGTKARVASEWPRN